MVSFQRVLCLSCSLVREKVTTSYKKQKQKQKNRGLIARIIRLKKFSTFDFIVSFHCTAICSESDS